MQALREIFFGRLASLYRERWRARRRFGHRRAMRGMRLEPLEQRLLLSADPAGHAIAFVDARVAGADSLAAQIDA